MRNVTDADFPLFHKSAVQGAPRNQLSTLTAPAVEQRESSTPYYPQVDALRAVAILLVFAEHWTPYWLHRAGLQGGYGVWLFFAISGFLITEQLLRAKVLINQGVTTQRRALATFYVRRALRIFPAYYLFLLVAVCAGTIEWNSGLLWHLLYASNFATALNNSWVNPGHLWSLAVEEQFYLVWPLLLLWLAWRKIAWALAFGLIVALAFRLIATLLDWGLAVHVIPLACLDTLGAGAYLAWLRFRRPNGLTLRICRWIGRGCLALLPIFGFLPNFVVEWLAPTMIAAIAFFAIDCCINRVSGPLGALMSWPPLLQLGRISYGLYLYHGLVTVVVPANLLLTFDNPTAQSFWNAAVWASCAISIATLSWLFFERPINSIKRYWVTINVPTGKPT